MLRRNAALAASFLLLLGCNTEKRFAGRYALRAAGGVMIVFEFDTLNRYWPVDEPDKKNSYYLAGDTVFLSQDGKGVAFIRNGEGYNIGSSPEDLIELVRIQR